MGMMSSIKCEVCDTEIGKLIQLKISCNIFVCHPCITVWYNDWKMMQNPWLHGEV